MPYFGYDPTMLLLIPGMLLAMWAQLRLSSAYSRYSQAGTYRGLTGFETARTILDRNGLQDVEIHEVDGHLSDHYDPTKRAVFLSSEIARNSSIASVAVAAHEVGHAIQHKTAYSMLELRMALVPITGFASNLSMIILMIGIFLTGPIAKYFLWGGVAAFAILAFFQLITLPVEYDASSRAKKELARLGIVQEQELPHVASMLNAAALTYVAAMVSALLQLLRILMIARNRDHDER